MLHGFDAYKKLLAVAEVNYVILATLLTSGLSILKRRSRRAKMRLQKSPWLSMGRACGWFSRLASWPTKDLGIVAGTQRRHMRSYNETIKRLQDGAIGEILCGRAYWNGGVIWVVERQPGWTDMEWQLRNWNYFTWLGGDHIVEQHVHNLDILNWAFNAHPLKPWQWAAARPGPTRTTAISTTILPSNTNTQTERACSANAAR